MEVKKEVTLEAVNPDHISQQEQFLMDYLTCCLCGGDLMFTHVTNFINSEVVEQSSCECCHIRQVTKSHRLQ
jgi:hypothetical protein